MSQIGRMPSYRVTCRSINYSEGKHLDELNNESYNSLISHKRHDSDLINSRDIKITEKEIKDSKMMSFRTKLSVSQVYQQQKSYRIIKFMPFNEKKEVDKID